jgi:hypothetical protein
MIMRGSATQGWVKGETQAFGDDALRRRLLQSALAFIRSLPPKTEAVIRLR